MGKLLWIFAFVVLLGVGFYMYGFSEPPSDAARATITGNAVAGSLSNAEIVAIDMTQSTFGFVGYGPGKEHTGTFNDWIAQVLVRDNEIVGFTGTIQAASVQSDGERVTAHLKNEDFFDVAKYPTITFESTGFDETNSMLTGILTFRGIAKEITFPVTRTDNSLSADFVLNTKPFNMKYEKITNQVKITFNLVKG